MPDILAPVARFVIRTFDVGNAVAAEDEKKITAGTPALGILSTSTDDKDSWVATGRALSAILLELTAAGYTASFLNQPIEVPDLRPALAMAARLEGFPQVVLRLGKADVLPEMAARRDVSEVLI